IILLAMDTAFVAAGRIERFGSNTEFGQLVLAGYPAMFPDGCLGEFNVRSATGHVCCDGDFPRLSSPSDNVRLGLDVSSV
ncbi:hypothetical protein LCGC14_2050060, partial [marine sediment metagenome]